MKKIFPKIVENFKEALTQKTTYNDFIELWILTTIVLPFTKWDFTIISFGSSAIVALCSAFIFMILKITLGFHKTDDPELNFYDPNEK